jgi:hypothetical protein
MGLTKIIEGVEYEWCGNEDLLPYFGKMVHYCDRPWPCPACSKNQDMTIEKYIRENTNSRLAIAYREHIGFNFPLKNF